MTPVDKYIRANGHSNWPDTHANAMNTYFAHASDTRIHKAIGKTRAIPLEDLYIDGLQANIIDHKGMKKDSSCRLSRT